MKRASYREGVEWIAVNDEPMSLDPEEIRGFISTLLLADLFEVAPERVARDIVRWRKRRNREERAEEVRNNGPGRARVVTPMSVP